ncbi:hypothetical protein SLA2020_294290 [Shorea laevis]
MLNPQPGVALARKYYASLVAAMVFYGSDISTIEISAVGEIGFLWFRYINQELEAPKNQQCMQTMPQTLREMD